MFKPYKNRIEVKPLTRESILEEEKPLIEVGEVVAIGEGVDFVKVGDIIYFDQYGCTKTAKRSEEDTVHYTVYVSEDTILGKESKEDEGFTNMGSSNGT